MLLAAAFGASAQPYWNNPGRYRLNMVQPRDRVVPEGGWIIRLDDGWRMACHPTPAAAEQARKQGKPLGERVSLPFAATPEGTGTTPGAFPSVSADSNTACLFARRFALPAGWQGRRTVVRITAAASAACLYVNGCEAGYAQDGLSPAEWDITRHLQQGTNEITIKTIARSDGSYLDIGGLPACLLRGVALYSLPATHISDIKVVAGLDTADMSTGLLDVMVDLNREVQGGSVEWAIERGVQRQSGQKQLERGDWFTSFGCRLPAVQVWSDSTPALYRLTLVLRDAAGRETERLVKNVGFRHVAVKNRQLMLNGRRLEVRGATLNGLQPTAPADSLRHCLEWLKAQGYNTVRTAGWTDASLLCDLCDSIGIYVWDDANLSSPFGGEPLKDPSWLNPVLDRVYNLYRRDRNHPSVIVWSLGVDCVGGYCLEEAYRFLKGKDSTRPVACSGAQNAWNTDIVCPAGRSARYLGSYARNRSQRRPFVLSGYDNRHLAATGALQPLADTVAAHPCLQGGFALDASAPALHNIVRPRAAGAPKEWQRIKTKGYAAVPQIADIVASREPDSLCQHLFPALLADGCHGDTAAADGWLAYTGADTLTLVAMLANISAFSLIEVGAMHHPARGVLRPLGIDVQWSADGRKWSRWQSLAPAPQPEGHGRSIFTLALRKPAAARFVRLRMAARATLPVWHPLAGHPARLLVDEVEIR